MQQAFDINIEKQSPPHKPLEWIKGLNFPPTAGPVLSGKKIGDYLLDFQESVIKSALTYNGQTNKSVFLGFSRKISKSFLYSLVATWLLEHSHGLSAVCMASCYSQTAIVFDAVKNLILFSDNIKTSKYKILKDTITNKENHSLLRKTYNSPSANLGLQPSFLIADELGGQADSRNLDSIVSGMALAVGGKGTVCYASNPPELPSHWSNQYIKNLRTDPDLDFYDFSASPDDDIHKAKNWSKANPFVEKFLSRTKNHHLYKGVYDFYIRESRKAKQDDSAKLTFMRMQLGIRCSQKAYQFVDIKKIQIADDSIYEDKKLRCALGIDLSFVQDFTAFTFVFFDDDSQSVFVKPFLFLANLKDRRPAQRALFQKWHDLGFIHIYHKPEISIPQTIDTVKNFIEEKNIKVEKVMCDQAFSKQWRLSDYFHNLEEIRSVPSKLTGSIRYLEKTASSEKLFFIGENDCLKWMFDCCGVSPHSTNFCSIRKLDANRYFHVDGPDSIVLGLKHLTETRKKRHLSFIA